MYYTYVLLDKISKRFYTGFTDNLRKRLMEHQKGHVNTTKSYKAVELIYYEACIDKYDALAREKYLKTGMGKRFIKNRIKRFLSLTGETP